MSDTLADYLSQTEALPASILTRPSSEIAQNIAQHIIVYENEADVGAELETLKVHKEPGQVPKAVSRSPRNWLINWKKMLFDVVPKFAATGAAAVNAAGALTATATAVGAAVVLWPLAGIVVCMGAVYALVKAGDIELGEDQATVVRTLWLEEPNKNLEKVSADDLREQIKGQLKKMELTDVLKDLHSLGIVRYNQEQQIVLKHDEMRAEP